MKLGSNSCDIFLLQVTDDPDIICTRAPLRTAPRIACFSNEEEQTYYLFIEHKVLCTVSLFTRALMLWFMCYYIFNLEYAKQTKDVCLFFQEFVFDLPEKSKTSKTATYLTLTSDIASFVKIDP